MKLSNTETGQNLKTAFLRESAAFMEYSFFATQAKIDGYENIYNIFNDTASNEREHAKIWFKLYHAIYSTKDNLLSSADLEKYEYSEMYNQFAKIAEKEGFSDIANLFTKVGEIEKAHEKRFLSLAKSIENNNVFSSKKPAIFKCLNCGYVFEGESAPKTCPVCSHPQSYFYMPPELNK